MAFQFRRREKIDFQVSSHGGHLGFLIRMILATSHPDATYQISGQLAKAKNRSLISNWNNFSYFLSKSHPDASNQVSSQLAFRFRRSENKFSRWRPSWISDWNYLSYGSHLGFPNGTILAIFDLQILDASYQVSSQLAFLFKRNIDFQDGHHSGHTGFLIGKILSIFYLQYVSPMLPTKFLVNWPFGSGEEAKNRCSRRLLWQPSWISDHNYFSYF